MDVLHLLDRLEEVINSARRMPLSSRVMVDEQECLDVIDQLRLALPAELKTARRVLADRDQILAEADDRASRLVEHAEEHAARQTDDHAVVLAAEGRARNLVDQAEREAKELRHQADTYAYRVFASLHKRLRQVEGVVQQGLQELHPEEP